MKTVIDSALQIAHLKLNSEFFFISCNYKLLVKYLCSSGLCISR